MTVWTWVKSIALLFFCLFLLALVFETWIDPWWKHEMFARAWQGPGETVDYAGHAFEVRPRDGLSDHDVSVMVGTTSGGTGFFIGGGKSEDATTVRREGVAP